MLIPIVGVLLGIAIGMTFPVTVPVEYGKYMSVALLACLDSVFGGIRAGIEETFDNLVFVSGFFVNAILAVLLVYVGDRLGIDLYYVASLAFGLRIFQNLAMIRRDVIKK